MKPSKFVQAVTLMACIRKKPGSHLGLGTGYSEFFRDIFPPSLSKFLKFGHNLYLLYSLQFIIHSYSVNWSHGFIV